jgi:ligand-binding SRPBCC domain-containing protein
MYSLDQAQRIEAPLEAVFAFFSDPANLARITPPWLSFRVQGTPPASLAEGDRIEYRIRWGIFTLRWVTRITRWRPTSEFEDVQEKGPYRTWIHTHRFFQRGSLVVMEDHVEYALPFGVLGRIVHRLRVRRQLVEIFAYRRRVIDEIFGPGAATAAVR